jgi:hypothetical protein
VEGVDVYPEVGQNLKGGLGVMVDDYACCECQSFGVLDVHPHGLGVEHALGWLDYLT